MQKNTRRLMIALSIPFAVACAGCPTRDFSRSDIQLALSLPKETTLGVNGIPAADQVWLEMIDGATSTIDLATSTRRIRRAHCLSR